MTRIHQNPKTKKFKHPGHSSGYKKLPKTGDILTVRPAWFKRNHRTKPRAIALCWGYVLRNFLMYPLATGWQWWGFQFTIVHSPTGRHPDLVGGFNFLYVVNHRKGSKRDDWLRWRGDDVGTGGSTTLTTFALPRDAQEGEKALQLFGNMLVTWLILNLHFLQCEAPVR